MTINKPQYKSTIKHHKAEIKQLKRDIKAHKLMIKQAKTSFKMAKLTGAKIVKKPINKPKSHGTAGMAYEQA